MLTEYCGEIVNAVVDRENPQKVILTKFAYVPGFEKHFDQDIKKFLTKKLLIYPSMFIYGLFFMLHGGEKSVRLKMLYFQRLQSLQRIPLLQ